MPRKPMPPRLYLDKQRNVWAIRHGTKYVRVGSDRDDAQRRLDDYLKAQRSSLPRPPRQPRNRKGLIYVIGLGQYVKIGFTAVGIETRMKYLRVSMPERPTVLGLFEGTKITERRLHQRFTELRANGEWFRNEGDLTSWVESGCPTTVTDTVPEPLMLSCRDARTQLKRRHKSKRRAANDNLGVNETSFRWALRNNDFLHQIRHEPSENIRILGNPN